MSPTLAILIGSVLFGAMAGVFAVVLMWLVGFRPAPQPRVEVRVVPVVNR